MILEGKSVKFQIWRNTQFGEILFEGAPVQQIIILCQKSAANLSVTVIIFIFFKIENVPFKEIVPIALLKPQEKSLKLKFHSFLDV